MSQPLDTRAPLTRRQREILAAAETYREIHGSWPSRSALGIVLGIPANGYLQRVMVKLRSRGLMAQPLSSSDCWWARVRGKIEAEAAEQAIAIPAGLLDIIREAVEIDHA